MAKYSYVRFIVTLLIANVLSTVCVINAQQLDHRKSAPQTVTLLSQIKHNDFAKANFNFGLGVRGDSQTPPTRNYYDLRYGGVSLDGDNDWIEVPISGGSRSQIKDLGELGWADVYDIPILFATPMPHSGGMSMSYDSGKLVKVSPEHVLVKAIPGHMYLLHAKDNRTDLYV